MACVWGCEMSCEGSEAMGYVAGEAGPRVCESGLLPLCRDLDTNKLTGTIPTELGDLSSLQTL